VWCLGRKRWKIMPQVAAGQRWGVGSGDFDRCAQQLEPVSFPRPDERFKPGDLVAVADVQRLQVQTGSPRHIDTAFRERSRGVRAARERRHDLGTGRDGGTWQPL